MTLFQYTAQISNGEVVSAMRLIINADDYGKDLRTTLAIVDAFSEGFCSSTTIMATGDVFEEAIELAKKKLFFDKIGLHINLTEGRPISEPIRMLNNFCDTNGFFNKCFCRTNPIKGFTREEKEAVYLEIRAQIEKCHKFGLKLSHIDSHHHVHTRWDVWQVVGQLLRDFRVSKVRISRNCGKYIPLLKQVYKFLYNNNLRVAGFKTTNYFGSVEDVLHLINSRAKIINSDDMVEVMVHPLYQTNMELIDLDGRRLGDAIKAISGWKDAAKYSEL